MRYALLFSALLGCVLCAICPAAGAWTTPVRISGAGEIEASIPRIARGAGGKLLVAYRHKEPGWDILYRERSAAGAWGPIEQVSAPWTERPDVLEDPLGRPHMFFAGTGAGGKVDLFEAYKQDGTWSVTQFTNTADLDEDYPRLATDSLGRMHMVYSKSASGSGGVYYRVWQNGTWSAETYLGANQNTYYHRPDMSVDTANNVHVVYGTSTNLYYRKLSGSGWLPQMTIATTTNFFSYPKVAAASPADIAVVVFDQRTQATLNCVTSNNGGTSWSGLTYLNDGHYPSMDTCNGCVHLVYEWAGGKSTGYRRWDGASWSAAERCTPDTRWQGWADVAADAGGVQHVVYDQDSTHVSYVSSAPDSVAPGTPTSFAAVSTDSAVQLSWTNPTDPDFQATAIRFSTAGYPTSPADGALVCDRPAAPGSQDSFTHANLENGQTCYYAAFAYDPANNHSDPAYTRGTPHRTTCGETKMLTDGAFTKLTDKVVTAVFSSDACIYVEEPDRSSGIRVAWSGTGLGVGDRVSVTGSVGTRTVSGCPAERMISANEVAKLQSGPPLEPLGMGCACVGGGAVEGIPGVAGAIGTNNMGLLVKITGRVTKVLGSYLFVDDGSQVANVSGSGAEIGVMVRCPSTPSAPVGSIVSATGIAEGSIPSGWKANRRYIRLREMADLIVHPL